jgi:hypothetical protein
MNTTSSRVTAYAGAVVAGLATSIMLAAPANAMRPDPNPDQSRTQVAAPAPAPTRAPTAEPTSGGIDWAAVASGLAGGVALTGGAVIVGSQSRRRRGVPA